jgi:predicted RNA-binding protein with PUA-like domain
MAAWILKTEPDAFSWEDLVRDGRTAWTGVRNHAAAKNLKAMRPGDIALIYHTGEQKAIVGTAKVVKAAYQDPTAKEAWVAVDIAPLRPLKRPVTLAALKAEPGFADLPIVRQGRLSVSPVTPEAMEKILKMS